MKKNETYINGKMFKNEKWLNIINPETLEVCGAVPALDVIDVKNAYDNARKTQKKWEAVTLLKRVEYLKKFNELLLLHKNELISTIVKETSKNISEATSEVVRSIELIDFILEDVKRLPIEAYDGESFDIHNKIGIYKRVAKGIVLAIAPYNYPLNLAVAKIIPGLVTGNCVVFKPATQGSLTGCLLGKIAYDAKLPDGIFQVITGKGKIIGDVITTNKEINMISFTGSVKIGKRIQEVGRVSDLVLELGGKDTAFIVDDNNLEMYCNEIISGAFSYSGQRCTAIKRIITTNKIADQIVKILKTKINKLKVGPASENNDICHLIDMNSANYVKELIDDAINKKAKIICGNKFIGNLLWPTLIDYVTKDMRICWEEQFGPVLPIVRCDSMDEMIQLANDSEFGLQASIFSHNINIAIEMAKKLDVGTVNINAKSSRGPDNFPFLGVKNSGVGVQGVRESLLSMTRLKGIVLKYL